MCCCSTLFTSLCLLSATASLSSHDGCELLAPKSLSECRKARSQTSTTWTDRQTGHIAIVTLLRKPLSTLPALTESDRGMRMGRSRMTARSTHTHVYSVNNCQHSCSPSDVQTHDDTSCITVRHLFCSQSCDF